VEREWPNCSVTLARPSSDVSLPGGRRRASSSRVFINVRGLSGLRLLLIIHG
jgi:hypothetical protein